MTTAPTDPNRTGKGRTVLVTGAAGGLGSATVRLLSERGFAVIAADIPSPALEVVASIPGVTTVPLDVTDQASVDAMATTVAERGSGLDGVVNFAGVLEIGSMAELPVGTVQRVLDINVLGTYRVNAAVIDLLIERKGRVVNISSETGWQSGGPFNGAYAMSKHAIEAYSDSLRRELGLLGVKVIKIQPGPFRTAMTASIGLRFDAAARDSRLFGAVIRGVGELAAKEEDSAADPDLLAAVIERALTISRPRAAYSVRPGRSRVVLEWLPTRVADALLRIVLRRVGRS